MKRIAVVAAFALLLLAVYAWLADQFVTPSFAQAPPESMGAEAKAELDAALDILSAKHVNRNNVDWSKMRESAYTLAANAKTAVDVYPVILAVIKRLGEKHTSLISASEFKARMNNAVQPPASLMPNSVRLSPTVLMINLPELFAGEKAQRAYVSALRGALDQAAADHICRIIVDLREDRGGNMYPMINGVAALLGQPPYGYWSDGIAAQAPWIIPNRPLVVGESAVPAPYAEPVHLRDPVFTAVLISSRTASAGEDTAMAFKGLPHVRFFGENSAGYVSANQAELLPDGAALGVTVGWIADRTKQVYRDTIAPDEQTPPGQKTVDAAKAWLDGQHC